MPASLVPEVSVEGSAVDLVALVDVGYEAAASEVASVGAEEGEVVVVALAMPMRAVTSLTRIYTQTILALISRLLRLHLG